jgi:hypothetical protein
MTLDQFTTNQNITISLHKVQAEQIHTEHKVKDLLTELKVLLDTCQSNFLWR